MAYISLSTILQSYCNDQSLTTTDYVDAKASQYKVIKIGTSYYTLKG